MTKFFKDCLALYDVPDIPVASDLFTGKRRRREISLILDFKSMIETRVRCFLKVNQFRDGCKPVFVTVGKETFDTDD